MQLLIKVNAHADELNLRMSWINLGMRQVGWE